MYVDEPRASNEALNEPTDEKLDPKNVNMHQTGQIVVSNPGVIYQCIVDCAETDIQQAFLEGTPYKKVNGINKHKRKKVVGEELSRLIFAINDRLSPHAMSAEIRKVRKLGTIKERLVINLGTNQSILWEDLREAINKLV